MNFSYPGTHIANEVSLRSRARVLSAFSMTIQKCLAIFCIFLLANSASAAVSLGELIRNGGSIAEGNLVFSDFTVSDPNLIVEGDGNPDTVDGIHVEGVTTADGSGLRFSGPFFATALEGDRSIRRFFIQFDVEVAEAGFLVEGLRHAYEFATEGAGNVSVFTRTETLPGDGPFAQIVSPNALDGSHVDRSASIIDAFTGEVWPVASLRVFSGITVESERPRPSPREGSAYIESFDQTFKVVVDSDTAPPELICDVETELLWPPNHKLVDVGLDFLVDDPTATVEVTVFANENNDEPTGDGTHSPDAVDDGEILRLRSERRGDSDGRIYLIVVTATDAAGNVGFDCCTTVVPHSKSKKAIADVDAHAAFAEAFCLESGEVPPGFVDVGDGSRIGPKQ